MPKCEFCDMMLQSQLDVSKHLVSQTHRDNVKKRVDVHPLEKSNLKDTPNNIVKVFESLKLRTVNDVRSLADKGYFRIPDDSPGILSVADQLVHVFLKCIAEHRTRNLQPETRKIVMDSFERVKQEPKTSLEKERQTRPQPQPQQQLQSRQSDQRIPQRQQRPSTNVQPERPGPSTSPPLKRRPPTSIPAQNSTRQTNTVKPHVAAPSSAAASVSSKATHNPTVSSRTNPQNGQRTTTPPAVRETGPPRSRTAALIPNPRVTAPAQRNEISTTATGRPPAPGAVRVNRPVTAQAALQAPRPPIITLGIRPPVVNLPTAANRHPGPQAVRAPRLQAPQAVRTPRPDSGIPPPGQMPMAGASFLPWCPIRAEEPPQPRLDSSYRPKLAKIKVEPKDD